MSFDKTISIKTSEGYLYKIGFSKFKIDILPETLNKELIDVVIVAEDVKGINNASTLFSISKYIKQYLIDNDVILYCYCDILPIGVNIKNKQCSPQEYRSLLFKRMFDREYKEDGSFINKPIELVDLNNETHYIHLFTRSENTEDLQYLSKELVDRMSK